MPTQLTTARHLDGLHEAVSAFVVYAGRAGLDAAVPTCPGWSVLDLVAHLGMVHRWASALLRGERPADDAVASFGEAGRAAADPLAWLGAGAEEVAATVRATPEDAPSLVFLNDAPAGRAFWARRQCHETTMHAVDALGASLTRFPRPDEVWIDAALAADGIDELLGGFLTRPHSRLRCEEDALLVVRPDDLEDRWEVALSPGPAVVTRRSGGVPEEGDWELTGSSVELYLRLWNRTEPGPGPDEDWRRLTAVSWS